MDWGNDGSDADFKTIHWSTYLLHKGVPGMSNQEEA